MTRSASPLVMQGVSTEDTVPALLKKNEFVQNDKATNFWGTRFMHNVNNRNVAGVQQDIQAKVPLRFETGGLVPSGRGITPPSTDGNFSLSNEGGRSKSGESGSIQNKTDVRIEINVNIDGTGQVTRDTM